MIILSEVIKIGIFTDLIEKIVHNKQKFSYWNYHHNNKE